MICYKFAVHLLCLVAAPPCNPNTSALLPLCPETCQAYDKLISSGLCDRFLSDLFERSSEESTRVMLSYILRSFNCSYPDNTADIFGNSLSLCTSLFSSETEGMIL